MSADTQMPVAMTHYVNERVEDVPVRILNRGPEYIRSRMMNRDSALFRHKRRSAVELLAETKPLYIKSELPDSKKSNTCDETDGDLRSPGVTESSGVRGRRSEGSGRDHSSPQPSGGLISPWTVSHGQATGRIRRSSSSPTPCQTQPGLDASPGQDLSQALSAGESPSDTPKLPGALNNTPTTTDDSQLRHSPRQLIRTSEKCCDSSAPVPPVRKHRVNVSRTEGTGVHKSGHQANGTRGPPPEVPPRVPPKPRHLANLQMQASKYGASPSAKQASPCPNVLVNGNMEVKVNYPLIGDKPSDPKKRTNKDIPTISTEEWRETRADGSEVDKRSSNGSVKTEESATIVRLRHRKAISRSRSDLTKRYSNSSDFSELSARLNRNSGDLEKFFNEMGLDHTILEPLKLGQSAQAQSSSSLNLFESVSCLGSTDARSCFSEDSLRSDGRVKTNEKGEGRTPGSSVVERNARIIKWLCNIKMASSTPHLSRQTSSTD